MKLSRVFALSILSLLVVSSFAFGGLTQEELAKKIADNPNMYNDKGDLITTPVGQEEIFGSGNDSYGNTWIDSDEPGGPAYNWIDVTSLPGATQLSPGDDWNSGPLALGFNVFQYGNSYSNLYVCSNGWTSFTSTLTTYFNQPLPYASGPFDLVAPYWDDLNPSAGGQMWFWTNSTDSAIVAWLGVPHYSNDGAVTMEMIITGQQIFFMYDSLNFPVAGNGSGTIGMQNQDGTVGMQIRYNTVFTYDDYAVQIDLALPAADDIVGDEILAGIMYVDSAYTPQAVFTNAGTNDQTDVPVWFEIWFGGSMVYQDDTTIDLLSGQSGTATFMDYTPTTPGYYVLEAYAALPGDENPGNDYCPTDSTFAYNFPTPQHFEDFEANNGAFLGDGDWEWGAPTSGPGSAYSGSNVWATVLGGDYNISTLSELITPYFYLSDASPTLAFWHWFDTEASYDGGNMEITTDNGATWTIIPNLPYTGTANSANPIGNGEPIITGHDQGFWEFVIVDLSAYAGDTVRFKYVFGADGSVTYPGWYFDDFLVAGGERIDVAALTCNVNILTPTVPSINGDIVFDLEITNTGTLVYPEVYGEIYPTIGDCATGQVFDFNLARQLTADLQIGESFVGRYFYHVVDVSGLGLSQVALTADVGMGVDDYQAQCCDEFHFTNPWGRSGGEVIWGDKWLDREDGMALPTVTSLGQNYPNPFNATTSIPFNLAEEGNVTIKVYNLTGQLVETLVDGKYSAGNHVATWDASTVSSGVYFYSLEAGDYSTTKKMNLLK
ncbi:MAG: T9SS type A sorting domain-containing protein [candidate division Zixibacteria bacterium]|nr:T9SS type A sorting domain-containing protein [candidate division Zixibacteria bacterium]